MPRPEGKQGEPQRTTACLLLLVRPGLPWALQVQLTVLRPDEPQTAGQASKHVISIRRHATRHKQGRKVYSAAALARVHASMEGSRSPRPPITSPAHQRHVVTPVTKSLYLGELDSNIACRRGQVATPSDLLPRSLPDLLGSATGAHPGHRGQEPGPGCRTLMHRALPGRVLNMQPGCPGWHAVCGGARTAASSTTTKPCCP